MATKYEVGAPYGAAESSLTSSLASTLASPLALAQRVAAGVAEYWAFRSAEKQLHALDDRMLKDIGIERSQIRSALNDAAEQRQSYWRT